MTSSFDKRRYLPLKNFAIKENQSRLNLVNMVGVQSYQISVFRHFSSNEVPFGTPVVLIISRRFMLITLSIIYAVITFTGSPERCSSCVDIRPRLNSFTQL